MSKTKLGPPYPASFSPLPLYYICIMTTFHLHHPHVMAPVSALPPSWYVTPPSPDWLPSPETLLLPLTPRLLSHPKSDRSLTAANFTFYLLLKMTYSSLFSPLQPCFHPFPVLPLASGSYEAWTPSCCDLSNLTFLFFDDVNKIMCLWLLI